MTAISPSGGFLPSPLTITPITSPAPSHNSLTSSLSDSLPRPRSHALRAGSKKEEAARRYIEGRLLAVSRRFVKKFQEAQVGEAIIGYTRFSQVCRDLSEILDVVWLSGTPSLQVPYLLNIALNTSDYLTSFPAAPKATFSLLRKLDYAFTSLLKGVDAESGQNLPGFEMGEKALSRTDMVRIKGIVDNTRTGVVNLMSAEDVEEEDDDANTQHEPTDDSSDDDSMDGDGFKENKSDDDFATLQAERLPQFEEEEGENDMDVARVYERTIVALNEALASDTGYEAGD